MTSGFITVLQKFGIIFKDVFKDAAKVAVAAEPIVAVALPAYSGLYNMTVSLVTNAEAAAAAAGAQAGSGIAKSALIINALTTYVQQEQASLGVKAPTQAQTQKWIDSIVAALNAFEAA